MKILLADDHPLFRAGVKLALEEYGECSLIAEAKDGIEAFKKISDIKPDIAILDVRMPGKSGLEILAQLAEDNSSTKVILLTMYKNPNYFYQAISFGAKGYLSKEDAVAEIIKAVKIVSKGGKYTSTTQSKLLFGKEKSEDEIKNTITAISTLTHMEKEVLKLVGDWKTNSEIGEILFISSRTAGNHRTNISTKLNLRGSHSIIKFALENKDLFS